MWFVSWRKTRVSQPARRLPSFFRPRLEALEDRCLLSALPSAGALDPTFGKGAGYVTTSTSASADPYGSNVLIQPDGKIIVLGETVSTGKGGKTSYAVVLTRSNSDGSLDTSFGNAGTVMGPALTGGAVFVNAALYPTAGTANDGKIVVSGVGPGFSIARFNGNGSLDSSFGSHGIATANFGRTLGTDGTDAVVILPDGKIVALGQSTSGLAELARFNASGSLDTTFGQAGLVTGQPSDVYALLLQPDGKLIVVGEESTLNAPGLEMVRYNANGTLDTSFGNGGVVTNNSFGYAYVGAIYPVAGTANDGKIVVAGGTPQPSPDLGFELARYNPDGSLDGAFGSGGLVTTQITPSTDFARAVAIQADGRIVAAGTGGFNTAAPTFALARYNVNGSLDGTFGTGGIVTTLIGVKSVLYTNAGGVALQQNGDIVVAGSSYNGSTWNFAVARYLPSEPQIGSFTASPNPVTSGSSVTLTASNITDANPNSTITQVAFYVDSNGDGKLDAGDALLGYGTQSNGVWTYNFSVNLAPGSFTLFAQAEDSYGVFGNPFALTLQVT